MFLWLRQKFCKSFNSFNVCSIEINIVSRIFLQLLMNKKSLSAEYHQLGHIILNDQIIFHKSHWGNAACYAMLLSETCSPPSLSLMLGCYNLPMWVFQTTERKTLLSNKPQLICCSSACNEWGLRLGSILSVRNRQQAGQPHMRCSLLPVSVCMSVSILELPFLIHGMYGFFVFSIPPHQIRHTFKITFMPYRPRDVWTVKIAKWFLSGFIKGSGFWVNICA